MRKAAITLILLGLAGCDSTPPPPQPLATDQGLGAAIEAAASPAVDPMAPASDAPMPEANGGAAAVQ